MKRYMLQDIEVWWEVELWTTKKTRVYEPGISKIRRVRLKRSKAGYEFFWWSKSKICSLAAAKVGGIMANNTYRAQFIYDNLMIQNNVIHESYRHGVKKLLFMGYSPDNYI